MKILFISDNFPPETNAPASRTYEHAVEWVKQGHHVTVITCAPNFPKGKVYSGYRNAWYSTEIVDGIQVIRVKTYITQNTGFFKRILDFLSFMVSSSIAGLFVKRSNIVIATSPQFFTAVSGWFLSKIKGIPFVFEVRDIWPASLEAVGFNKFKRLTNAIKKIELFLYAQASLVVVVTNSFKKELSERGVLDQKIKVIFNGVDASKYFPRTKNENHFKSIHNLHGKFIVAYVGTLGLAHALDTILNAAENLQHQSDIVFLFVGEGAMKDQLVRETQEKCLNNVVFVGGQSKDQMPLVWSACDVSLVSLRNVPLFKMVIPSKIFESMASGLPIIMSTPKGEASKIVTSAAAGVHCVPESPKLLADAILSLKRDCKAYDEFAINGIKTAKLFDRKKQASQMLAEIERILK